jgi:hypothetical protein
VTRRRVAAALAAVAFIGASLLVARWLAADGEERARVVRLLEAQGRGDPAAMARELEACDGGCRRHLEGLARRLSDRGDLELVRFDSPTARALGEETGPTRVVWRLEEGGEGTLPTVQCVTVRRSGGILAGPRVSLLRVSAPVGREASC